MNEPSSLSLRTCSRPLRHDGWTVEKEYDFHRGACETRVALAHAGSRLLLGFAARHCDIREHSTPPRARARTTANIVNFRGCLILPELASGRGTAGGGGGARPTAAAGVSIDVTGFTSRDALTRPPSPPQCPVIALNPIDSELIPSANRIMPTIASPISHSRDCQRGCHSAFSRLAGFCSGGGSRRIRDGGTSAVLFPGFLGLLTGRDPTRRPLPPG